MFSFLSQETICLILEYLPLNYISKELRNLHLKKFTKQREKLENLRYMMDSCLLGYSAIMIREFQKCLDKKRVKVIPIIYRQQCIAMAKTTDERCKRITRNGYHCSQHKKWSGNIVLHQTFHSSSTKTKTF